MRFDDGFDELRAERDEAEAAVERLEARVAELEAVLRKLEWSGGGAPLPACPICEGEGYKYEGGHAPGCELAAALGKAAGPIGPGKDGDPSRLLGMIEALVEFRTDAGARLRLDRAEYHPRPFVNREQSESIHSPGKPTTIYTIKGARPFARAEAGVDLGGAVGCRGCEGTLVAHLADGRKEVIRVRLYRVDVPRRILEFDSIGPFDLVSVRPPTGWHPEEGGA